MNVEQLVVFLSIGGVVTCERWGSTQRQHPATLGGKPARLSVSH